MSAISEPEGADMKHHEPLPRLTIPHEQAKQLEEKRKAAKAHLGGRWLGIPVVRKKRGLTARQRAAQEKVLRKFA